MNRRELHLGLFVTVPAVALSRTESTAQLRIDQSQPT